MSLLITPLSARRTNTYSDVPKTMDISPVNSDTLRLTDEESVMESIRNLVMTNRGERKFQPELGCDIRKILFENMTFDVITLAREMVESTIKSYEPRCNLIGVDIIPDINQNLVSIIIVFSMINREEPVTFTITLNKVR